MLTGLALDPNHSIQQHKKLISPVGPSVTAFHINEELFTHVNDHYKLTCKVPQASARTPVSSLRATYDPGLDAVCRLTASHLEEVLIMVLSTCCKCQIANQASLLLALTPSVSTPPNMRPCCFSGSSQPGSALRNCAGILKAVRLLVYLSKPEVWTRSCLEGGLPFG